MSSKLELAEQDVYQRFVSDFIRVIDPIIQFLECFRSRTREAMGVKRQLESHIDDKILLMAAPSNKIDRFASL